MSDYWLTLPHHRQEREYSCTPACIRMMLSFFGRPMEEDEICLLVGTSQSALAPFRNIRHLDDEGFDVTIRRGGRSDLEAVVVKRVQLIVGIDTRLLPTYPKPGGPHSVVVAGAAGTEICVYDPDLPSAPNLYPAADFLLAWGERDCRMAVVKPG